MSKTTTVTVQPQTASESEQEPRRAIRAEHDRNLAYYLEHADELDARYPKQFLLIHSGGEVLASADLAKLHELRDGIVGDVTRVGSIIQFRKPFAWRH